MPTSAGSAGRKEGNALPERTIELLRQHKVGLFGAITSKPKKEAEAELDPALKRQRAISTSAQSCRMRQIFNLDICMRPCLSFPGNPLNFIRKKSGRRLRRAEGRRRGLPAEYRRPVCRRRMDESAAAGTRSACARIRSSSRSSNVPGEDLAVSVRIITRPAARRICEAAFRHARKFGYKSVTICEKPNVLRETSGMMEEAAKEVQKQYSEIPLWSTNIDAQTMWLTKNPEDYGVIVASNLFGDVISDAFAGLVGGLGFRGVGQHRRRGCGVRADARLGAEVCRAGSADRQSDRHDSVGGDDARPHGRNREGDQIREAQSPPWWPKARCAPTT